MPRLTGSRSTTTPDRAATSAVASVLPSSTTQAVASGTSRPSAASRAGRVVALVGYELWRDANLVARPAGTTATIDGFTAATRACFTVVALDKAGNRSGPSEPACATTLDLTPPTSPLQLTARAASDRRIELGWMPASDNVGVTAYQVVRGGKALATVPELQWADEKAAPAVRACYVVHALDAAGNRSKPGNEACAYAPGPDAAHHPGQPGRPGALLRHRRPRVEPVPRRRGRDRLRGGAQGAQALPRGQAAGDRRGPGASDRVLPPGPSTRRRGETHRSLPARRAPPRRWPVPRGPSRTSSRWPTAAGSPCTGPPRPRPA